LVCLDQEKPGNPNIKHQQRSLQSILRLWFMYNASAIKTDKNFKLHE
jgi:hypothetical protein